MYILIAITIGILIGFVRRGSITSIFKHPYKKWLLGFLGALILGFLHISYYFNIALTPFLIYLPILHFIGFLLLLFMFIFNLEDISSISIALGLSLEFIEIFINGGYMPISDSVLNLMPSNYPLTISITQGYNAVFTIMEANTTLLPFLGTIMPIPFFSGFLTFLSTVPGLSIGYTFILLGLIGATQGAMVLSHTESKERVVLQREPEVKTKPVIEEPRVTSRPAQHQPDRERFVSKTEELFFEEFPLPKDPLDKIFADDDVKAQTQMREEINTHKKAAVETGDIVFGDLDHDIDMLTRPLGTGIINTKEVRENIQQPVNEGASTNGFFASKFLKDKLKAQPVHTDEIFNGSEVNTEPITENSETVQDIQTEVTKELNNPKDVFFDIQQYQLFVESIKDEEFKQEIEAKLQEMTQKHTENLQTSDVKEALTEENKEKIPVEEEKPTRVEQEKTEAKKTSESETVSEKTSQSEKPVVSDKIKQAEQEIKQEEAPKQEETVKTEEPKKEEAGEKEEEKSIFEVIDTVPEKSTQEKKPKTQTTPANDATEITGVVDTIILPEIETEPEVPIEEETEEIPEAVLVEEPKKRKRVKNKELIKNFGPNQETQAETETSEVASELEKEPEEIEKPKEKLEVEPELETALENEAEVEIKEEPIPEEIQEEKVLEPQEKSEELEDKSIKIETSGEAKEEISEEETQQTKIEEVEVPKLFDLIDEAKPEEISKETTPEESISDKIEVQNGLEDQIETKEENLSVEEIPAEENQEENSTEFIDERLADFIFDEELTEEEKEFLLNNIDNFDELMEDEVQQSVKRGSFIQDEESGYFVNKSYKEKISQMDRSEEEMMNVWAQVSQENRERKQSRRRRASRNYQTNNPYREEEERATQRRVEQQNYIREQQAQEARNLRNQQNNYYNKTSEVVNSTAGVDVRNLSDAERRAAGYEKVTIQVQGKSISFWQKKN